MNRFGVSAVLAVVCLVGADALFIKPCLPSCLVSYGNCVPYGSNAGIAAASVQAPVPAPAPTAASLSVQAPAFSCYPGFFNLCPPLLSYGATTYGQGNCGQVAYGPGIYGQGGCGVQGTCGVQGACGDQGNCGQGNCCPDNYGPGPVCGQVPPCPPETGPDDCSCSESS